MAHLDRLLAKLDKTDIAVRKSEALLAAEFSRHAERAVPPAMREADEYETKLRETARINQILSAAGFGCELHHGVTLQ